MNRTDSLLASTTTFCLFMAALCWLGPALDDSLPDAAAVAHAVASSQAADDELCRRLHGPLASAVQLPDGQHRCADARGRPLSMRSAITLVHSQP